MSVWKGARGCTFGCWMSFSVFGWYRRTGLDSGRILCRTWIRDQSPHEIGFMQEKYWHKVLRLVLVLLVTYLSTNQAQSFPIWPYLNPIIKHFIDSGRLPVTLDAFTEETLYVFLTLWNPLDREHLQNELWTSAHRLLFHVLFLCCGFSVVLFYSGTCWCV